MDDIRDDDFSQYPYEERRFMQDEDNHVRSSNLRYSGELIDLLWMYLGKSRFSFARERYYVDLLCIDFNPRIREFVYTTPLHIAVAQSHDLQRVEHILQNKETDKNHVNSYGDTALSLALKENVDESIINTLIEYGCDVKIACHKGVTPLHLASLDNKLDLIRTLISKGADPNAPNILGVTPLHYAVLGSNYEAVRELLTHDADPTLVTTLPYTPLMLALGFRDINIEIVDLLCKYGINTRTSVGNATYCAVRANHRYARTLIDMGGEVNYIGVVPCWKTSCIIEAASLTDKDLFLLIWSKLDQDFVRDHLMDFLVDFAKICRLVGSNLVECLVEVLRSPHAINMLKYYYDEEKETFLRSIFERKYQLHLTLDNWCDILSALPIVYYEDISYVFITLGFNRSLETLLKSYVTMHPSERTPKNTITISYIFIDYICYNKIGTGPSHLEEVIYFLKYCSASAFFRQQFYRTHYTKATVIELCQKLKLAYRPIGHLLELSRDAVRKLVFSLNKKPYKAISELDVTQKVKDILFLKTPLYS